MSDAVVKEFVCVSCPVGCMLEATVVDGRVTDVQGYGCKRGVTYAQTEATDPRRVLTSLVDVQGSAMPASVKSNKPVPKVLIPDCLRQLRGVTLQPPVHIGDVVLADVCGTGADIVATKAIEV